MSVKILAVDQVLRCLPHHLKTDDGFEDAMSLAQATRIERCAHKTAVEYHVCACSSSRYFDGSWSRPKEVLERLIDTFTL